MRLITGNTPGNRPKPTALKLVQGNPSRRPINKDEPQFKAVIPACPAHLSKIARVEWNRVAKQLHEAGLLTTMDRAALAAYCQAWGRWVDAEKQLAQHGTLVRSPNNYPMPSPYLSIANRAMRQMHSLLVEFGMTPSARSRIKANAAPQSDPFDDLLSA